MHTSFTIGKLALLPSLMALALTGCEGGESAPPSNMTGTPVSADMPISAPTTSGTDAQDDMLSVMLDRHNDARSEVSVPPVTLDPGLSADALAYAEELAATDRFEHSAADTRRGQGENLWTGTAGMFSSREMVDAWIDEKRLFTPGRFPDIASNGRWQDVGHYTQIIWEETDRIGCGLASSARRDYLVCRYAPQGNIVGQSVGE